MLFQALMRVLYSSNIGVR